MTVNLVMVVNPELPFSHSVSSYTELVVEQWKLFGRIDVCVQASGLKPAPDKLQKNPLVNSQSEAGYRHVATQLTLCV